MAFASRPGGQAARPGEGERSDPMPQLYSTYSSCPFTNYMPFPGYGERSPSEPSLQFHWGRCVPFGHARFACLARFKYTSWGRTWRSGPSIFPPPPVLLLYLTSLTSLTAIIDPETATEVEDQISDRVLLCDAKTICPPSCACPGRKFPNKICASQLRGYPGPQIPQSARVAFSVV
jgi:hypothetical protein